MNGPAHQASTSTHPIGDADPDAPAATCITITTDHAEQAAQLLALCDGFLRHTPTIRAELTFYLDQQPDAPDTNLLIDLLGFTAQSLHAKVAHARHQPATHHQ